MSILHNKNDENYIYYLVAHNLKAIRKEKGFTQAPVLEVNGEVKEFRAANTWVEEQ